MHEKAIDYYNKAITVANIAEDKNSLTITYANLGSSYLFLKNYELSKNYLLKAKEMAEEINSPVLFKLVNEFLSDFYKETKDFKNALFHYKQSSHFKDSIFNIEKHEDITRQELTYEFEKKEAELKANQDKKDILANEDKKRNRMFIWFLVFALLSVFSIVFLIYKALKTTKKQKQTIEKQKELVEEKQKEILDSIIYARRIQDSIFTSVVYMERNINRLKR